MQALYEDIKPEFNTSFLVRKFEHKPCHDKPRWHFHPEYEIVYIQTGRGKRRIGDHVGEFYDGELVFLGPNLPHMSYVRSQLEVVVQMKADFLGQQFFQVPELQPIRILFERAAKGLVFYGDVKHHVGHKLLELVDMPPFQRLLTLLDALHAMAQAEGDTQVQTLNANSFAQQMAPHDRERITTIYDFVENNFQRHITLEEIAALVNMTVPAFCRYFKKLTNRTFTQFVNEFRITYSSRLLRSSTDGIASISFESGFNNLSHFNKQFKATTGLSPSAYREEYATVWTSVPSESER